MFELDAVYSEEDVVKMSKPAVLPEGEYGFEVVSVLSEVMDFQGNTVPLRSKTGNPMMELTLKVWDAEGATHKVKDWLVQTNNMLFKIRHLCESCGLLDKWESKRLHGTDFEGQSGRLLLTVQKGGEIPMDKRKPGGDTHYSDRNSVKDYIRPSEYKPANEKASDDYFNDDIAV